MSPELDRRRSQGPGDPVLSRQDGVPVIDLHPGADSAAPATPPERAEVWRGVRRALAIRVDNLGDVLMTSPALAATAASVPGVELTLLGGPGASALAPHLTMLHDVIEARVPWVRHPQGQSAEDDHANKAHLTSRRWCGRS